MHIIAGYEPLYKLSCGGTGEPPCLTFQQMEINMKQPQQSGQAININETTHIWIITS